MEYLTPESLKAAGKKQGDAVYAVHRNAYKRFETDNLGCEHIMRGTLQNDYFESPSGIAYFLPDEGCAAHGPKDYIDAFWLINNFLFADSESEAVELLMKQAGTEIDKLVERLTRMKSLRQREGHRALKLGAGTALLGYSGTRPEDDCGDPMNVEDFKSACRSGCITNDDGTGDLMVDGTLYPECRIDPDGGGVWTPLDIWISFDELPSAFEGKDVLIIWYNK